MAVLSRIPGMNALRIGATCCTVALVPVAGHAASITFDFSASGPPAAPFDLFGAVDNGFGDITGSLTFDSTTPNTSGPSAGIYPGAITQLSFTDDVGNSASATTGDILVASDPSSFTFDASAPGTISSSGYGSAVSLEAIILRLTGGPTSASVDLPSAPPALGDFGITSLTLVFLSTVDGFTRSNAIYDLDTLSLRETSEPGDDGDPGVIPLPAGLPLLLGGLAAFGLLRARRAA